MDSHSERYFSVMKRQLEFEVQSSLAKRPRKEDPEMVRRLADVHLPDPAAPAWDGSSKGRAVNGTYGGKTYLGFPVGVAKSGLQKAIRNGEWKLACIMMAEGLGNLSLFGQTSAARAVATNMVNRLMTIAVEDCAASPHLVHSVLDRLLKMIKAKEHYDGPKVLPVLCRIVYALCQCHHFRPSTLTHAFARVNRSIAESMNIHIEEKREEDTVFSAPRDLRLFGYVADSVSNPDFVAEFWNHYGKRYPQVYEAYKLRSKARDFRAYLQYVICQEVFGTQLPSDSASLDMAWPEEGAVVSALRLKRYSAIIPTESIIYDIHTSRHTPEGAEEFRRHASVVHLPLMLKQLTDFYLPVYVQSVYV